MAQKPLNVVVVGGSLGGLFAGVIFKRLGHNVRILERNPTPLLHNQGAGVVAGGDTQEFFHKYDATKRPIAVTSKLRHYLDREGHVIHREQTVQKMTSWDLLYFLLRANFDGVESGYCKLPGPVDGEGKAKYEYGHLVKELKDKKDHVEVDFEDKEGQHGSTSADLVIGADGPSSTIRKILLPEVRRTYAGYVAWRGTIPEDEASPEAKEAFVEKFAFYHTEGIQILSYTIPGEKGALEPGKRLINWVWYANYPEDSNEFAELMTDSHGKRHHNTLPIGGMRKEIWEQQQDYAKKILPPQFAEIVTKTQQPFIQAITDVLSPKNSFFDGKVLLIGDAVAGFRPHTAASTSQAAFDAQKLDEMVRGDISRVEWERNTMEYARHMQERGVALGERSQFGRHPLAQSLGGVAKS
ncbi:MAG: hypothetical protein M1830_006738 [Pleopsidium flavum]|nr:MAG: hypothetical protein M1830_006738 [Pleopsidium flavum]